MRNRKRVIALLLAVILAGSTMDLPGNVVVAADGAACASCDGIYTNGFCSKSSSHYQKPVYNEEEDYYEIENAGQLYWFKNWVNGNTSSKAHSAVLMDDIVVNENLMSKITIASDGTATVKSGESLIGWTPIGTYVDDGSSKNKPHTGMFDGNNHTISGLYFNGTSTSAAGNNAGLFGYVVDGTVQNVNVTDSYFGGTRWVGGIVGRNMGTVFNCSSTAVIYARFTCGGGIAGYSEGAIEKCSNTANIFAGQYTAGGIAGSNYGGTIEDCYNTGKITAPYRVGGIAGTNKNDTTNAKNASIVNCYNAGTIVGTDDAVGGVAGVSNATITTSYYPIGCATDGSGVIQNGVGVEQIGSKATDEEGCTIGKDAEAFASGEVAYLLNKGVTDGTQLYYQTCGEGTPAFSGKTVYRVIGCDGVSWDYNNVDEPKEHVYNLYIVNEDTHTCTCRKCGDELEPEEHSKNAEGDRAATCVDPAYCSVCRSEYGDIDANNHSYGDNGECQACSQDTTARVSVDGAVAYFKELQEAIDYAEARSGSNLKLLKNVYGIDESVVIDSGSFTLDLNGKNLGKLDSVNQLIDFVSGELTVCNSAVDVDSEIRAAEGTCGIRISGGTVKLESGIVNGIVNAGGVLILDGAVVKRDVELRQGAGLKLVAGSITGGIDMDDFTSCITVESALSEIYTIYSGVGGVGKFAVAGEGVSLDADKFVPADASLKVVKAEDGLYLKKQIAGKVTVEDAAEFTYVADTPQAPAITADGVTLNTDYTILYESTDNGGYHSAVPPVNVGAYRVTVTGIGDYTGTLTDEWLIKLATPGIGTVTANTLSDTLDVAQVVLSCTDASIPGTLRLTDTALSYGTNVYHWEFAPDNKNYETITGTVSITVNDTVLPTATYRIGEGEWKPLGTEPAYGLFTKDNQTMMLAYADGGSDIKSRYYYVSEEALDVEEARVYIDEQNLWTEYDDTAITLTETGTYFVYVKVVDKAENSNVLCSEGIVIFEDGITESAEVDYTYRMDEDRSIEIALQGNTVKEIKDAAGNILPTTNYSVTVTEDVASIILKAAYLNTLDAGNYQYSISLNPKGVETDAVVSECEFAIAVKPAEITVTGATATSRIYNGTDVVEVTAVALDGVKEPDRVSIALNGLLGTISGATVGSYTTVTLPALFLNHNEKGNYVLLQPSEPVATSVTISPVDAAITLTQASYTKTFGDEAFLLEVTHTNTDAEAKVEYEVTEGTDVVSVADDGTITILEAGTATITVSLQTTTNYNAAESQSIIIMVNPAASAPNMPSATIEVDVEKKVSEVELPADWVWEEADADTALVAGEQTAATALYVGEDKDNYETIEVVITISRQANPFADVDENGWQYPFVKFAFDRGLMGGNGTDANGKVIFRPNDSITREQFVQILHSKEGKPDAAYADRFHDVVDDKWYTTAIMWATENGVVAGKDGGTRFGLTEPITREEMATMLRAYATFKGWNTDARADFGSFADASDVSGWATQNMQWAIAENIMAGKGERIAPRENATRAEAATMLKALIAAYE